MGIKQWCVADGVGEKDGDSERLLLLSIIEDSTDQWRIHNLKMEVAKNHDQICSYVIMVHCQPQLLPLASVASVGAVTQTRYGTNNGKGKGSIKCDQQSPIQIRVSMLQVGSPVCVLNTFKMLDQSLEQGDSLMISDACAS